MSALSRTYARPTWSVWLAAAIACAVFLIGAVH